MLITSGQSMRQTTAASTGGGRQQLSPPQLHLNGAPGNAADLLRAQEPGNNNKLSVVLPNNQKSLHTPNIITSDVASPSQLFGSLIHQLNSHGEVGLFTGLASCTPTSADALAPSPSLTSINPFFWNVAASHSSNDSKHSSSSSDSAASSISQQQHIVQPEALDTDKHQKATPVEQLSMDQLQAASAIMLSPLTAFSPLSAEQEAWFRLHMPHRSKQIDTGPQNQVAAHQQPPNSRPAHQQPAGARLNQHAHSYLREPQSGGYPVVAQLKTQSVDSSHSMDKSSLASYTNDQQQQQISTTGLQFMAQQASGDPTKTDFFPTGYPTILYQQQQQQQQPPSLTKRSDSMPPAAHLSSSQAPPDFTVPMPATLPGTSPIHYELFHYDPKLQHLYLAQQHHNDTTPIYSNLQHQHQHQQQQRSQCYQELPIKQQQQQQQPSLYQQHHIQPPSNVSQQSSSSGLTQTAAIVHTSSDNNAKLTHKQQQPLNSSNISQQKMNPVCELTNKENLLAHSSFSSTNPSFNSTTHNHGKPLLNNSNVISLVASATSPSCSSSTSYAATAASASTSTPTPDSSLSSPSKSDLIHPPTTIKCMPPSEPQTKRSLVVELNTTQAPNKTPHPKRASTSGNEKPEEAGAQQDLPELPKKKSKVGRKKKQVSHDELVARKNRSKERNRVAAKRCRQKRKQFLDDLRGRIDNLNESNKRILKENLSLRSELELLKWHHKTCRIN